MKFNFTSGKYYTKGVKLLLLTTVAIVIISVYQTQLVVRNGKRITNTEELVLQSKTIRSLAMDNESSFRAYVLTGRQSLLQPFERSQKDIKEVIARLVDLATEGNKQKTSYDSLVLYVNKRMDFKNQIIANYSSFGSGESMKAVELSEGGLNTERIRLLVDKLQDAEKLALVSYKKTNEKSVKNLQRILLLIVAGILSLLAVFIRKIRDDNIEKVKTAASLKKLNDDLELRVAERTEELDKKEKLFRALVENNEGIILLIDENMNVIYRSASAVAITGREFIENEKVEAIEYVHIDDRINLKTLLSESLANPGKAIPVSFRVKHNDGHFIWLEGLLKNMIHNPAVQGVIVNLRDISYQVEEEIRISKAILDAQEKERRFIGAELHDNINQLLASSLMAIGMVKKEHTKTEESYEFLEMGRTHIFSAVDEVRKLSHKLAPASFDKNSLKDAFEHLLQSFNLNKQYSIKLNFDLPCNDVNEDVQINLYRILQEQIKNIAKYAEASEIEISVAQVNNVVKMRIYDNGKGFNVNTAKKGIGLNNMKKRAESFSGKFVLKSAKGKGCEVLLELPLAKAG